MTLFGINSHERSITVEGPRLSQPDGMRLQDVFPELEEDQSGLFGLEIALQASQPRIDLSYSNCIIELAGNASSCRFWPAVYGQGTPANGQVDSPAIALKDCYQFSSLVVVNSGSLPIEIDLSDGQSFTTAELLNEENSQISERSVKEFYIKDSFYQGTQALEMSWGLMRTRPFSVKKSSTEAAYYMLYRDATTKRPISVVAL
ncbi:MAG: hypothetical protein D6719_08525 [Candidatus Dadabacteria bacterium]|nr:MAG: hypothetical protein D6719_08525 [Candidatus Dadabacteria bacterium]